MKLTADWINDATVQKVFSAFEAQGHQIYLVGGCVRNALLNCPTTDLDFSTSATPDATLKAAKTAGFKAIPTGIEHGTITLVLEGQSFEVTSFRKDVETHGRRAVVAFSDKIEEDARRRDFTMNAIYVDRNGTLFDPLHGLDDLRTRKVRFIEDPETRIKEDYLRILRYFRFHAQYGDQDAGMNADALAGIAAQADGLNLISKERIGAEFRKILMTDDPVRTIAAMEAAGVLMHVLPGSTAKDLGPLTAIETHLGLAPDWLRRLLCLSGQDFVENLRLSKPEAKRVSTYFKAMDRGALPSETAYRFGYDTALDVTLITAATLGQFPTPNLMDQLQKGADAQFPVTARDLPDTLVGKAIGDRLRALEEVWIASDFQATKHELLAS